MYIYPPLLFPELSYEFIEIEEDSEYNMDVSQWHASNRLCVGHNIIFSISLASITTHSVTQVRTINHT